MTDANTICHDVDLLGDWLDSRGYTEEAGLCLRVLGLIHEQAEENAKLRAALKRVDDMVTKILMMDDAGYGLRTQSVEAVLAELRAAAAALKETGDD